MLGQTRIHVKKNQIMKHNITFLFILFFISSHVVQAANETHLQTDSVTRKHTPSSLTVTRYSGLYRFESNYDGNDTTRLNTESTFYNNKLCKKISYNRQTQTPLLILIYDDEGFLSRQQTFSFKTGKLIKEECYTTRVNAKDKKAAVYEGLLTQNYDDGSPRARTYFKLGDTVGTRREYYPNGRLKMQAQYEHGLMKGLLTQWNENGTLKCEKNYVQIKDDRYNPAEEDARQRAGEVRVLPHSWGWCGTVDYDYKPPVLPMRMNGYLCVLGGISRFYTPSGALDTCRTYKNDLLEGITTTYYPNGQKQKETTYKEGKIEGPYTEWYETGRIKETGVYYRPKANKLVSYYPNGIKKREAFYKGDEFDGDYTFYENGSMHTSSREFYLTYRNYDGIRYNGRRVRYKPDGTPWRVETYLNGRKHGAYLEYYDDVNQLKTEKEYYYNALVGDMIRYNEQGKIITRYHIFNPRTYLDSLQSTPKVQYIVRKDEVGRVTKVQRVEKTDTTQELRFDYCRERLCGCITLKKGLQNGFYVTWNVGSSDFIEEGFRKTPGHINVYNDSIKKEYNSKGLLCIRRYNKKGNEVYTEYYDSLGRVTSVHYNSDMIVTDYYPNGKKSREYVKISSSPHRSDVYLYTIIYYEDGQVKSMENRSISNDLYGDQVSWSKDGTVLKHTQNVNYSNYKTITDTLFTRQLHEAYTHQPQPQGETINGRKEGRWVYWFDTTHKQYEMTFKHGILNGPLTLYYPNGNKAYEADMNDGQADDYTTYHANGSICHTPYDVELGASTPDTLSATHFQTEYFPNGDKKQEQTFDPQTSTYTRTRFPDKAAGYITTAVQYNCPDKDCTSFDYRSVDNENHLACTYSVRNGLKEGLFTRYSDSGKKEYEVMYVNGRKQGLEQEQSYMYNRPKKLCYYDNGVKNGMYKLWWHNYKLYAGAPFVRTLKEEGRYAHNLKDSVWKYYSYNGKLKETGRYRDGIKDGLWKRFDNTGKLVDKSFFSNGIYQHGTTTGSCPCLADTSPVWQPDSVLPLEPESYGFYKIIDADNLLSTKYASTEYLINNIELAATQPEIARYPYAGMYPLRMVAREPLVLVVPAPDSLNLIVNPCTRSYRNAEVINLNYDAQRDEMSINTKQIALSFHPRLLHRIDPETSAPQRYPDASYIPAWLYISCNKLQIGTYGQVVPENQHYACFEHAEIGNTGFALDFDTVTVDLSQNDIYQYQLYQPMPNTTWHEFNKPHFRTFVGAYVAKARITLSEDIFASQPVEATEVYITSRSICGRITLPVTPGADANTFGLKTSRQNITEEMLKKLLEEKHLQIQQLHYDEQKREVSFLFNYRVED